MLSADSGERTRAAELASRALRLVKQAALEQYATSVLPYVVAARSALRSGDPTKARELLGQAHAKRPLLSSALPLVSVQTLLEMAQSARYCYEDFEALERILGDAIVLRDEQRIDESLFEPSRRAELLEALLSAFEVITATPGAVDAEAEAEDEALDEDDAAEADDEGQGD